MQAKAAKDQSGNARPRRDPAIELARVLACFIVVAFHVVYRHTDVKSVSFGMICVESLFTDGVSLFWMITGAFVFKQGNYPRLFKRTLCGIVVPLFSASMIYYALDGLLFHNMSPLESAAVPFKDWCTVLQGIVEWHTFAPNTTHLWYLFVYSFAMLLIPVVRPFVLYLDERQERQIKFCVATTALLVWNNVTYDKLLGFTEPVNSQVVYALIFIIWGHIIYSTRDRIAAPNLRRWRICSLLALILINLARSICQFIRLGSSPNDYSFLHWYSGFSLLCACSILIFCLAATKTDRANTLKKFICKLASYTFLIYLVHYELKTYLLLNGVWSSIRKPFQNFSHGGLGEVLFVLFYATILFLLSLVISIPLKLLHQKAQKVLEPWIRSRLPPILSHK